MLSFWSRVLVLVGFTAWFRLSRPLAPARRLQLALPDVDPALAVVGVNLTNLNLTNLANWTLHVKVPCGALPFYGPTIDPCSQDGQQVALPAEGLNVSTLFGTVRIPGAGALEPFLLRAKQLFSEYTVVLAVVIAALQAARVLLSKSHREELVQSCKDLLAGRLQKEDKQATNKERAEKRKRKLDIDSEEFICPGNIYRLAALNHPGVVGYSQWASHVSKATVTAYMQIFLPYEILSQVFGEWSFNGIKSPVYFLEQGFNFVSVFAALSTICMTFQSTCEKTIVKGAEANFHLMSHYADTDGDESDVEMPEVGGTLLSGKMPDLAGAVLSAGAVLKGGLSTDLLQDEAVETFERFAEPPDWLVAWNESLWCSVSIGVDIVSSMMLQMTMFFQVATYTGNIQEVALVAVALYFVFDLDNKIMDSNPLLRPQYRRRVLKQTEKVDKDDEPTWVLHVSAFAVSCTRVFGQAGLLMIVLISWKSSTSGVIIGGDGFGE